MSQDIIVNYQQLDHLRNLLESIDALLYSINKSLPELINAYEFRHFNQANGGPLNSRTVKYLPNLCYNNREQVRNTLVEIRYLLKSFR